MRNCCRALHETEVSRPVGSTARNLGEPATSKESTYALGTVCRSGLGAHAAGTAPLHRAKMGGPAVPARGNPDSLSPTCRYQAAAEREWRAKDAAAAERCAAQQAALGAARAAQASVPRLVQSAGFRDLGCIGFSWRFLPSSMLIIIGGHCGGEHTELGQQVTTAFGFLQVWARNMWRTGSNWLAPTRSCPIEETLPTGTLEQRVLPFSSRSGCVIFPIPWWSGRGTADVAAGLSHQL